MKKKQWYHYGMSRTEETKYYYQFSKFQEKQIKSLSDLRFSYAKMIFLQCTGLKLT